MLLIHVAIGKHDAHCIIMSPSTKNKPLSCLNFFILVFFTIFAGDETLFYMVFLITSLCQLQKYDSPEHKRKVFYSQPAAETLMHNYSQWIEFVFVGLLIKHVSRYYQYWEALYNDILSPFLSPFFFFFLLEWSWIYK